MASLLLALHNTVRWLVLLAAVLAFVRALKGIGGAVDYTTGAKRAVALFTVSTHVQFGLGVLLYFFSPNVRHAMADMRFAMTDPGTRYFVVEHPTLMVLAIIVATVTGIVARRGPDDQVRHRRAAIGVGVALALLLAGIPWHRPLLPHF